MKRLALIAAALAAILMAPLYPPLGDGFFAFDGSWLGSGDSANFGVMAARKLHHDDPRDTLRIPGQIWLVSRDTSGKHSIGSKIAVLGLPKLADDEQVFFGGLCKIGARPDPSVVAIGSVESTARDASIHQAWRADTTRKVFRKLATDGVTCSKPATKPGQG